VTYMAVQSGRSEIYVRDFPKGGTEWQVSAQGGTDPRWSRDGKEIFYRSANALMAASVATTPTFSSAVAKPLFETHGMGPGFEVSPDGKRFIIREKPEGEPPLAVHIVHNWFEEFRSQQSGAGK